MMGPGPPAVRSSRTSAERPAPKTGAEVFLRDAAGDVVGRISRQRADRLVADGVCDQVSAAGHIRLKLGIRWLPNGNAISGIPEVELSRYYRGDRTTARIMRHRDRCIGK
jgi:hypothetical protein